MQLPKSLSSYGAMPPIGMAYVAAAIRAAGHQLQIVDAPGDALDVWRTIPGPFGPLAMQGLSPQECVDALDDDVDVIGVTHMFLHEWPTVREIAALARARFPSVHVVLGGENATAYRTWIMDESPAVDSIVMGEGETTVVELLSRLGDGRSLEGLQGLAHRGPGGDEPGGPSARIGAVDDIPRPAWDLFPMENYLSIVDNHGVHRGRTIPMIATRGCPYVCTFCSSPDMWTTRYVMRDPADVVDELRTWVQTYGIENVNFCDLTAVLKRSWILEFADRLIEADLGIVWQLPTGTRSEVLDREVLDRLFRSGCRNVTYNPESGSEYLLDVIKKRVKLDNMLESLEHAHDLGLVTRMCFITGHPAERRSDVLDTARFIVRAALAGSDDASVMVFGPYPGSEDFKNLVADDQVPINEEYLYLALVRSGRTAKTYHPTRSSTEVVTTQMALLLLFYGVAYATHPRRFVDRVKAAMSGDETTAVDQLLRVKATQARRWLRAATAGAMS